MSGTLKVEESLAKQLANLEKSMASLTQDASPSNVHALRVVSRKVETAAFLCQDALWRRDYLFYLHRCKQIRALSNKARNYDVMLASLAGQPDDAKSVESLERRGDRSRRKFVRSIEQWLAKKDFAKRRDCISRLDRSNLAPGIAVRMAQLGGQYVVKATNGPICDHNVHGWRIATKRLRYAFEFLHDSGCKAQIGEMLKTLEQLQTQLGIRTDELFQIHMLPSAGNRNRSSSADMAALSSLTEIKQVFLKVMEAAAWCSASARQPA